VKTALVVSTHPTGFGAIPYTGDLAHNLARVAAYGYDGAELAIRDPAQIDADALIQLLNRHHLAVPAIGTGQAWGEEGLSYTDPDPAVRRRAVERTLSHLPFAARVNAVIIIGLLRGVVRPEVERARAMDWLVAALRQCCAAAQQVGVRLAIEPLNRYETTLVNTLSEGVALIEEVGAPNLGLLADTFHMNIEEPNIEASIARCAGHLYHVHVADSNRWHPGAGHIDFASILGSLAAAGYDGWISGEYMPLPDSDTAAERCLAHLKPFLPE